MPDRALYFLQNDWSIQCHVEPTLVRGEGGAVYPRLVVPLTIKVAQASPGNSKPEFSILGAFANLSIGDPVERIADAIPFFEPQRMWAGFSHVYNIEFVLDHRRLQHIEKTRSGDISLRLDVRFMAAVPSDYPRAQADQRDLFALRFEQQSVQFSLVVPQSHWLKAVLRGVGYGEVLIIEVPRVSLPVLPDFPHSADELAAAHWCFLRGDYDQTVAHCRSAIEPVRKHIAELRPLIESKSEGEWLEKLSVATHAWLETVVGSTYALSNKVHHAPSTGHFSRSTAEVILMMTTSIIAYVGNAVPSGRE